jgi:hypothetical protein
MSLLFMDSFDHYATGDLTEKWSSLISAPTINAGAGRRGTQSLHILANSTQFTAVKGLSPTGTTAIMGVAVKSDLGGGSNDILIMGFHYGAEARDTVRLRLNRDGSLTAQCADGSGGNASTNGNVRILGGTAGGVISANVYAYVELKVLHHASAGTVTIRVNGLTVLNLTGQNTTNQAQTAWSTIWLGGGANSGVTIDFDDLYVLDGNGAAPWNNFLGDCRVDARIPTGAGASSGWTPSAGSNFSCVDETPPNDDTDTITAATVGLTDTYVTQDAPVPGATIYGVQHCFNAKKMDAGACTIAPIVRHGGTNFPGVDLAPGVAYAFVLAPQQVNPGTGAAWVEADFNAAEFGVRKTL